MTASFGALAGAICARCRGMFCRGTRPPISPPRAAMMRARGIPPSASGSGGYTRMRSRDDGLRLMCRNGRCMVHAIKPETCVAGPFTFDVTGNTLRIFPKRESIRPPVPCLKAGAAAYEAHFRAAAESLSGRLARALPAREPDAINAIPEPGTGLVAEAPVQASGVEDP